MGLHSLAAKVPGKEKIFFALSLLCGALVFTSSMSSVSDREAMLRTVVDEERKQSSDINLDASLTEAAAGRRSPNELAGQAMRELVKKHFSPDFLHAGVKLPARNPFVRGSDPTFPIEPVRLSFPPLPFLPEYQPISGIAPDIERQHRPLPRFTAAVNLREVEDNSNPFGANE